MPAVGAGGNLPVAIPAALFRIYTAVAGGGTSMIDPGLESALRIPATRRQALALLSLTAMIASQTGEAVATTSTTAPAPKTGVDDGPLDEALALLQRREPQWKGGMSSH